MSQNKEVHFGVDKDRGPNKYEPTPPWQDIVYTYSQETTFHGVRFISAETKYPIRRLLWLVAVSVAMTLFAYLMVERLLVYYSYPKSVSLEVTYKDSLEFPAVTICNQNLFRLSRIQQRGLYDDVLPYLDVTAQAGGQTESSDAYELERRGCVPIDYKADIVQYTYVEVTFSSCKYLCQNLHDVKCSMILFMPLRRKCILQPHQAITFTPYTDNCTWVELYRRMRITDSASVLCNFESDCNLLQDTSDQEDWRWLLASLDGVGGRDHTTFSGEGHMFYMLESDRPSESVARLMTPYKMTNGLCVELYCWLRGPSQVTISVRGEDYVVRVQAQRQYEVDSDVEWQWLFAALPDGINQVIIEGMASSYNISGILIDDVILQPCTEFEHNCKRSPGGKEYLGKAAVSITGNPCLDWTQLSNVTFPHGSVSENKNYCRTAAVLSEEEPSINFIQNVHDKPWCLTSLGAELCDVPYCDCQTEYDLTQCDDGQCILKSALCDGVIHCDDTSDEISQCEDRRRVTCDFSMPFICGYDTRPNLHTDISWIRMDDGYFFERTPSNATGDYMQINTISTYAHMVVAMTTPDYNASVSHCLSFEYLLAGSNDSGQPQLSLYARTYAYALTGDHLWTAATNGWGTAAILVPASNRSETAVLDFTGVLGDPSTTVINVANVHFMEGYCAGQDEASRPQGEYECGFTETQICGGNSNCTNEDVGVKLCYSNLSISCNFNHTDLCGYVIRGTFSQFQWVRVPEFTLTDPVIPVYTDGCHQQFTEASGYITSPNYPSSYDSGQFCEYAIIQEVNVTIEIQWIEFNVGAGDNCWYSGVMIFDAMSYGFLGEYCGSSLPPPIISTGNIVYILLITGYDSGTGLGFRLFYTTQHGQEYQESSGFTLAAHFTSNQPYAAARAVALSPEGRFLVPNCLTFRYFIRSNLLLMAINETATKTLAHLGLDGGRAFHKAYIDLPLGRYRLLWEVVYDLDSVAISDEEYEIYRASLDAVRVTPGTCTQLREGGSPSISCDFQTEEMCGWKTSGDDPVTWSRVRFGEGDESFFGMTMAWDSSGAVSRLSTPTVNVSQASCLTVAFACLSSGSPYRLEVTTGNRTVTFHDLVPDQYLERRVDLPVGIYSVSFMFYVSAGYAVIRSAEMTNTSCQNTGTSATADPTYQAVTSITTRLTSDAITSDPPDELPLSNNITLTTSDGPPEDFSVSNTINSTTEDGLKNISRTEMSLSYTTASTTSGAATVATDSEVSISTISITNDVTTIDINNEVVLSNTTTIFTTNDHTTVDATNVQSSMSTSPTRATQQMTQSTAFNSPPVTYRQPLTLSSLIYTSSGSPTHDATDQVTSDAGNRTAAMTSSESTTRTSSEPDVSADTSATRETLVASTTQMFLLRGITGPSMTESSNVTRTTSMQADMRNGSTKGYLPDSGNATLGEILSGIPVNTSDHGQWANDVWNASDYDGPEYGLEAFIDVENFYLYAGHDKHDFIHSCTWNGEPCSNESITSTITNLGLCYAFNGDPDDIYLIDKTGAGFGLSLVINIEQYEYVSGPNTDAGIKVYMHKQDDIPQIKNLGFAVSPGGHSLVSVKYSGLSSLKAPYGSCGESSMYMFDQGTKYTHSRCTEQCATEYANETCGCVDAYMPGLMENCNLSVYLECLLEIEYLTGFRYSGCVCPEACDVQSYGAELSYAALSTLSVDSLLDNEDTDLEWKYHRALEIQQRVLTEKMQRTIENLQNITTRLNVFTGLLLNKSRPILQRINEALYKINVLAMEDIGSLIDVTNKYIAVFQSQIASKINPVIFYMEHMEQTLYYLQHRVLLGGNGNDLRHGQDAFQNAMNLMDTLYNSLLVLGEIEDATIDNPAYSRWYPHRLWSERLRAQQCKKLALYEADRYIFLKGEIADVLQAWDGLSNSNLRDEILKRQQNVSNLIACAREYKDSLYNAQGILQGMKAEIQTVLNTKFRFVYESVLNYTSGDVSYIKANISWMTDCLKLYSENATTKMQLAESITADTAAVIEHTLQNILSTVDTHAVLVLQKRIENSIVYTHQWLSNGLDTMLPLVTYFDHNNIENDVRSLNIWRKPFVDLDTLDILGYEYPRSETWRTWSRSISLRELVQDGTGSAIMSEELSICHTVLHSEVQEVALGLTDAKNDIVSAFNVLVADLNVFYEESAIGREFIFANILKMDVYFSALTLESVKQQKSYDTLNFLSEVGGYMGLLIGASTLTLCEVLDLVFYNLFLKCRDAGHRKRAVSVFVQPSKTPVDNTVTVEDIEDRYTKDYNHDYDNDFVVVR